MKISKAVTKMLAAMLWCAVSVGCVAEDVQKPAVSPAAVSPVSNSEPAKDSARDEIITTHVDPKTGEKYQELKTSFVIDKFNYYPRDSNVHIFGINSMAISYATTGDLFPQGKPVWPNDVKYREWDKILGRHVKLYCRLDNRFIDNKRFCNSGCSKSGSFNFTFDKFCTLIGNNNYYLIIE